MAELTLRRLRKEYGGHAVVDDISLTLPSGGLLTLLGPSGCGKSTTLRMIAGLTPPDAGQIRIGERDVTHARARERGISMVFQSLALFPHMTAAENIAFPLSVQGVPRDEQKARVAEALELIRMAGFAGRYPDQLSGGQRQRVALARAIVSRPAVLLLDEPFSALDRKLRDEMQAELRGLVGRLGMTTVFVTHDQEEAVRISDLVAVMNAGRIEQIGPPAQVFNQPHTRFVADFMGAGNFARGTVAAAAADGILVELAGARVVATPPPGTALAPGAAVTLTVRPEKARLAPAGADPAAGGLPARVASRMFEGAFTAYTLELAGPDGAAWTVRTLTTADGADGPAVGDSVRITWPDHAARIVLDRPEGD